MLVATGEEVHVTVEPSSGPIGKLCRELTETVTGLPLACLYAADRYHHVETEIRPLMTAGKTDYLVTVPRGRPLARRITWPLTCDDAADLAGTE